MSKGRRERKAPSRAKPEAVAPSAPLDTKVAPTIALALPTLSAADRKRFDAEADRFPNAWLVEPQAGPGLVYAFSVPVGSQPETCFVTGRHPAPATVQLTMHGKEQTLMPLDFGGGWLVTFRVAPVDRYWVALRLDLPARAEKQAQTLLVWVSRKRDKLSMVESTVLPAAGSAPPARATPGLADSVVSDIRSFLAANDVEGAVAITLKGLSHPLVAPALEPLLPDVIAAAANDADFRISPAAVQLLIALSA